jgi:hypothetical protein
MEQAAAESPEIVAPLPVRKTVSMFSTASICKRPSILPPMKQAVSAFKRAALHVALVVVEKQDRGSGDGGGENALLDFLFLFRQAADRSKPDPRHKGEPGEEGFPPPAAFAV